MITFPPEFVVTKFPGYFWNTKTQRLYTMKVSGELREMRYNRPNQWNNYREGYQVSYRGVRRFYTIQYLKTLQPQEIQVVYS